MNKPVIPQPSREDSRPIRIGEVLVAGGKMTSAQAEAAAVLGGERNMLFGQAAVMLGFVSVEDVRAALVRYAHDMAGPRNREISPEVVVLKDPLSPRAGDIRRLAQTLALRWFRGETSRPAISVISADRGEGRTTVLANLACTFAGAGIRTLLIDADLHNPGLHELFGLHETDVPNSGYYTVAELSNLAIIPASAIFDVEYEKFMRSAFSAIIDAKSAEFDLILVDTPAASVSNDYLLAGLATQGAFVVTREGVTRAVSATKMLNSCDDAGVPVIGGIMLKA